jgi:hypothetical protein
MNAPRAAESPADEHLREQREEVAIETAAMAAAYNALQPLGEEARYRAVIWLTQALDLPVPYRAIARRQNEDVPF